MRTSRQQLARAAPVTLMGAAESVGADFGSFGLTEPTVSQSAAPSPSRRRKVQWAPSLLSVGTSALVPSSGLSRTPSASSALLSFGAVPGGGGDDDVTAGGSSSASAPPPLSEVSYCLERYRTEVHGDHGLMTAVDSLYLTSLECQRKLDLVEIQRAAICAARSASRHAHKQTESDEAAKPPEADNAVAAEGGWRRELELKRAQAVEALAERAKNYVVGTRSTKSGLLQLATDAASKQAVLQRFKDHLEDEYAAGAAEIQASIEMVVDLDEQHYDAYLVHMQRSVEFWEAELESTFNDWEIASRNYYRGGERERCAWEELQACCGRLLECLRNEAAARPTRGETARRGTVPLPWQSEEQERADRALIEVCSRLVEIELEQGAHGFQNKQREELLLEVLELAKSRSCYPGVGHHLLRNADFCALATLQPDGTDRPVLAVAASSGQPWAAHLRDIFGALLLDLAVTGLGPARALEVGLLCGAEGWDSTDGGASPARRPGRISAEDMARWRKGWEEIRQAAVAYMDENREQRTALQEALLRGRVGYARLLVEAKADPEAADATGLTAIAIAKRYGRGEDASLDFLKVPPRLPEAEASLISIP